MDHSPLLINAHFPLFEQFCEAINGWNLDFQQLRACQGNHQLLQLSSPALVFSRSLINSSFNQQGATPAGYRTFNLLADDSASPSWCRQPISSNSLMINSLSGDFIGTSVPGFRLYTVSIAEHLLQGICEQQFHASWGTLAGTHGQVVELSPSYSQRLRHSLCQLCNLVLWRGEHYQTLDFQYFSEVIAGQLVEALLDANPSKPSKPWQKRSTYLDNAIGFIETNHQDSISLKALCDISGTSQRTLENIFRERFNVSPKSFITARKLHGVRRQLHHNSVSPQTNISDIANEYGFWHMGRFAQDYRKLYGELPRDTLQRA